MCPARLDVIEDKNFDLDGIEMIRQYLKDYKLKARPLCADSIEAVSSMGTEFQKYMLGQKTRSGIFFAGAQNCIDQYYQKSIVLMPFFAAEKIRTFFSKHIDKYFTW